MSAVKILETERLILEGLDSSHAGFLLKLMNGESWLKYIGDRGVRTISEAEAYVQDGPVRSYSENGYGLWCVRMKEPGEIIGVCGLLKRDYLPHPDIGFALSDEHMGKGYAFEIASATMEYAAKELKISTILAITTPDNKRSISLLEKLQLHVEKTFTPPKGNEELLLFST